MPQRLLIRSLSVPLIAAALAAPPAWAQGAAAHGGVRAGAQANVTLDFVNAEIEAVARTMATITGRNVVVDPRVRGTMSLASTTPVTPQQALRLFAAQLRTQGFALVENAGIELVVPEAEAKLHSAGVSAGAVRGGSRVETHIFRLQHENALDLVPVLRPLIGANNTINADPAANALIITDYGNNLQRLQSIIAALDVAQATQVEVIELHHMVALDLVPVVERLLDTDATLPASGAQPGVRGRPASVAPAAGGGAGGAYRTAVVAEPSSNSIIVRAANNAKLAEAVNLIERLDARAGQLAARGSNIHVVYLKNADATKLAVTLRATLAARPGYNNGMDATGAGTTTSAQATPVTNQSLMSQQGSTGAGLESGPTIDAQANNQPTTGGQIQADPSTNALIISAPEPVYRELRAAIDKLDQRRAQVYVESLIAEVRIDKMAQFGIQWQGVIGHDGDRNIGILGTNFGTVGNILGLGPAVNGIVSNGQVGGAGTNGTAPSINQGANLAWLHRFGPGYLLSALANFIQTSGTGNVLSTPTLLTLDNEEARIVVGQNVPLVTGSYANTGVGNNVINPFQTFERQDVGLTLRVRPQISEDGTIKMVIYQETSDVDQNSINSPQGIITNKRAIESSVLVNDGQVVVLGGLIQDQYSGSKSKVPLLGDLPLVGSLFRSESRTHNRTNLMVFLRPVVVRDAAATEGYSLSRYDYLRATQEITQPTPNLVLPISRSPVLPPIQPVTPGATALPAPAPLIDNPDLVPTTLGAPLPTASAGPAFILPAAGESSAGR